MSGVERYCIIVLRIEKICCIILFKGFFGWTWFLFLAHAAVESSQVVFNELVSIAQVLHNSMEKIQIKHTRPILITKHKKQHSAVEVRREYTIYSTLYTMTALNLANRDLLRKAFLKVVERYGRECNHDFDV